MRFHVIDDGSVVLRSKRGVFFQSKVYRFNGVELFAGFRGGFVRLYASGGTSVPDVFWCGLSVAHRANDVGRLVEAQS